MISRLLYQGPSGNKEESKHIHEIESLKRDGICGMYFDTTTGHNDFLLLPEEYCLAEDEKSYFHIHCEREGFRLFGHGNIKVTNIYAKIYLTNYRVQFSSECSITDDVVNFCTAIKLETNIYVLFNLH